MEERMKGALILLKAGKFFNVGGLKLSAEKKGVIEVTGWSRYSIFNNLTKTKCLKELKEIKELFGKIVNHSIELKEFINVKEIEYNLAFDDSGKASIGICSEKRGILVWQTELK